MPNRISYNGKLIDFTQDCFRLQYDMPRVVMANRSASGIVETLNVSAEVVHALGWRSFVNATAADATLKRNLQQWFSWAQRGGAWTFARDSGDMVLTTLSGAEAAGQTVIGLTSTSQIVAGRQYVIRSLVHAELVKVFTVDSGVQVTLVESLNHGFAAGDRFRSYEYMPARLISNANPIVEAPPLWFDVNLSFREDVNSL